MANRIKQEFAEQASDMLAAMLAQSEECILLLDRDDLFAFINKAGRQHLGLDQAASLTYDQWLAYWPRESQSGIRAAITQARAGQSARFEGPCSNDHANPRWCDLQITPVHDKAGTLSHVLVIARDVTQSVTERLSERYRREEAERKAEQSDSVSREMRHRFKNLLAVIASLLRLSARNASDAADLAGRFEQRLTALARAQDLLAIQREDQLNAATAVDMVLRASGAGERVVVGDIPQAVLSDEAVQQLALLLGELQTNALKYGALAGPGGTITLSGERDENRLAMQWREICDTPVVPPERQGGGLKLLERMGSVPGGKAQVEWHPDGAAVTFYLRVAD